MRGLFQPFCLTVLWLVSPCSRLDAAAWPSCAWGHRSEVTVEAGAAGHSDEIRIDLGTADFPAEYTFSADGDDVRVYEDDDVTLVDHVVTDWDAGARTATLYLRPAALAGNETRDFHIYVGDAAAASASDPVTVFPDLGVRLRSRASTADPTDAASALTAFSAATIDYDNSIRTSVSGLNNQAVGGPGSNYGWCVSAVLEVTAATQGVWEFRYGADFGRGGHLYVSGVELEEQWNDDLWWANSYANTNETLEGSITLAPGWHRYEALGFEGCCDGPTGFQARAPGGAFQDLSSTNFDLRAVQCVSPEVTVTVNPPNSCSSTVNAAKTTSVLSDPLGSADPYALPGSVVTYEITIDNPGQLVTADTISLVDALPPEVSLIVAGPSAFRLIDGATPSGLTFDWSGEGSTTDDVAFSVDGLDFGYAPTALGDGTDPAVTHVQFSPGGSLAPFAGGNSPSFTIAFDVLVR